MNAIVKNAALASGRFVRHRQIEAANDPQVPHSLAVRVIQKIVFVGRSISLADFAHLSVMLNWRG